MIALLLTCGARIEHEPGGVDGLARAVPLFADAVTLDPISACPGCGKPLAQAYTVGQLVLEHPTGRAADSLPKRRAQPSVRDQAAKLVRKAVKELRERQAQRAVA